MGALKFRVLLDTEQEAEIFRDIIINEKDNFESLYRAIISSFRFQGDQMASFYMSNDEWDKGHEISLMDMTYGDEESEEPVSVMSSAKLKDFMQEPNQKLILVYDFMRMWIFLIELVERTADEVKAPETLFAVGMAPPEDSKMANLDDDDFFDEGEDEDFGEFGSDLEDDDEFDDGYNEEDYRDFDQEY